MIPLFFSVHQTDIIFNRSLTNQYFPYDPYLNSNRTHFIILFHSRHGIFFWFRRFHSSSDAWLSVNKPKSQMKKKCIARIDNLTHATIVQSFISNFFCDKFKLYCWLNKFTLVRCILKYYIIESIEWKQAPFKLIAYNFKLLYNEYRAHPKLI